MGVERLATNVLKKPAKKAAERVGNGLAIRGIITGEPVTTVLGLSVSHPDKAAKAIKKVGELAKKAA